MPHSVSLSVASGCEIGLLPRLLASCTAAYSDISVLKHEKFTYILHNAFKLLLPHFRLQTGTLKINQKTKVLYLSNSYSQNAF